MNTASRSPEAGAPAQSALTRRIIPCLDVTAGRVVKGVNFVNLADAGDPVEIARRYNEQGADELTFLDITATSDGRDLILPIIEQVASQVFIPLTVGGGVRQVSDIQRLLNAGADKISINSAAVANPELVRAASDYHGSQCVVVAIDARRVSAAGEPSRWEVFTHGGRKATGHCSEDVKMSNEPSWMADVVFDESGLIPAIAQDADNGQIMMVAWMNRESLAETAATGRAVYWSRSRQRLWRKGEESGHVQQVHELRLDCDGDVVLLKVHQEGGIACHTGRASCFYRRLEGQTDQATWVTVDPVLKDPELIYK